MTYRNSLKIDEMDAFDKISKADDRQKLTWSLYREVYQAIKPQDGKIITKRIETAVKNALPAWNVSLANEYHSPRLILWQNSYSQNPNYKDYDWAHQINIYLPYNDNPDGKPTLNAPELDAIINNFWYNDYTNTLTALNLETTARWDFMADITAWNEAVEILEELKKKHANDEPPARFMFDWN